MEKLSADINGAIRKEFYAYRNGLLADTLRMGGLRQKYIFGLQLPQIKEIAGRHRQPKDSDNAELARALWSDRECREARLLACHLMPPAEMTRGEALSWALDVTTREEADILAFRLLRHLPFAQEISEALKADGTSLKQYTATAVERFLT